MARIDCRTQEALERALKGLKPADWIALVGDGEFTAYDSAQVTATGSAQVTATDSAQVTATGSAQVRAYGSAQVTATRHVAVTVDRRYGTPKVEGGVLIEVPPIETAQDWLDWHGLEPEGGMVTLYKGVEEDWSTDHARRAGISYAPGSEGIEAPDWDPEPECGGGLHLCPTPGHTLEFVDARRFVACPVRVEDIVVHPHAAYPSKVKVPRIVGPTYEVTLDGERAP